MYIGRERERGIGIYKKRERHEEREIDRLEERKTDRQRES
jgi:hypothetical protein